MESVRIGVIGLGWFGEIHCDAIQATHGPGARRALHAHRIAVG